VKLTDSEKSGLGTIFLTAKLSVLLDYRNSTLIIMINVMQLFLLWIIGRVSGWNIWRFVNCDIFRWWYIRV